MAWGQVLQTARAVAPVVYKKADEYAKKLANGKSLKEVVTMSNGPAFVGEALVKSGMPISKLSDLMNVYDISQREEVLANARRFLVANINANSEAAVRAPEVPGVSESEKADIRAAQIRRVIGFMGLASVAQLHEVAVVINSLTQSDVAMYKRKGELNPALGYF